MKFPEFHWGDVPGDRSVPNNVSFDDIAGAAAGRPVLLAPERSEILHVGFETSDPSAGQLAFTFRRDHQLSVEVVPSSTPCDLLFSADRADVLAAVLDLPQGPTFAGRFTIDDTGAGGLWRGPLPPLDLNSVEALRHLPRIAGASVLTHFVLTDSPVGYIAYTMQITEGRLDGVALGFTTQAEVMAMIRFEDYLRVREGEIFIADALVHGDLGGDFGKAQMFSGLTGSLEFRDGYQSAFSSNLLLSDYARMTRDNGYRALVDHLRDALAPRLPARREDDDLAAR